MTNKSAYHRAKQFRIDYFNNYVKGWKLRDCTACNGSGYYDNSGSPSCASCDGTGRERYKPEPKNETKPNTGK